MKKLIAIFILLSFAAPVQARMVLQPDAIESDLTTQPSQDNTAEQKKKQLEEDMARDYKKNADQPAKPGAAAPDSAIAKSGSNWWKWTLGLVVVGGIAAAAGGGGGGSSSSSSSGTGNIGASW